MEPFRAGQKGSSAMPHKRNPIVSERVAGLARVLRGYAVTALENQPLWHERDISHSSAERVILPDATILLDYLLVKVAGLVADLVVRPERMLENIERGLGLHASSRVLLRARRTWRPLAGAGVRDRPAGRARRVRRASPAARAPRARAGGRRPPARLADLDACFDDAPTWPTSPDVIARLDALVAGRRRETADAHR